MPYVKLDKKLKENYGHCSIGKPLNVFLSRNIMRN